MPESTQPDGTAAPRLLDVSDFTKQALALIRGAGQAIHVRCDSDACAAQDGLNIALMVFIHSPALLATAPGVFRELATDARWF